MDWISACKEESRAGFKVKSGRGRKPKMNADQRKEREGCVEEKRAPLSAKKLT